MTKYADRVLETTIEEGTGSVVLAGAVAGFQRFDTAYDVGDELDYTIIAVDVDLVPTGQWESGEGTYADVDLLGRTVVTDGSAGAGVAVDFAAGTKLVMASFNASSARKLPSQVVTDSTTARTLDASDAGKYIRFTNAGAKTLTVDAEAFYEVLPEFGEWHIRNVGAGNLTIDEENGAVVSPPAGGTLVVPQGGTVTIKRVGLDAFDLFGKTT